MLPHCSNKLISYYLTVSLSRAKNTLVTLYKSLPPTKGTIRIVRSRINKSTRVRNGKTLLWLSYTVPAKRVSPKGICRWSERYSSWKRTKPLIKHPHPLPAGRHYRIVIFYSASALPSASAPPNVDK